MEDRRAADQNFLSEQELSLIGLLRFAKTPAPVADKEALILINFLVQR